MAWAIADGWRRARPHDNVLLSPLADGGEGTLVSVEAAGGWDWHEVAATDPIDRPVRARWLRSSDGRRAVVELAEASGLSRLTPEERDPTGASTFGTGQVLRAVIDSGVEEVTIGIGGSATTDGGFGILEALGVRSDPERDGFLHLDKLGYLANIDVRVACDVTNPLLGARGAAATYGPQKGATPGAGRASSTRTSSATPTSWPRGSGATSARRRAQVRPAGWGSRCCRSRTAFDPSPCAQVSTSSWS